MTALGVYARLGAALLAVVAGAGAIVVAVELVRSVPGPPASASNGVAAPAEPTPAKRALAGGRIPTPATPGYPSPPYGAIVLAREAGNRALAIALVPGKRRSLFRVSVVSAAGPGATGLDVHVRFAAGAPVALEACAPGCYQATVAASRVSSVVSVSLGKAVYPFRLPATRLTADGTPIVARAVTTWRALKTLVWHERLAGSPTEVLHTVYKAVAPDELSYAISGGSEAVIIGTTRWDRATPSGRWSRQETAAIEQPVPFWASDLDTRVLGSKVVGGHSAWLVSFFDPATPAWFEAVIDKRTHRTLELRMTAASHFMHHVYGPFNAPFRLHPPT